MVKNNEYSEESLIDEDKESIRALMTVLRERMKREKSKEVRFDQSKNNLEFIEKINDVK